MYWIDESDTGRLMSNSKQIPFWADDESDIDNLPGINTYGVKQGEDTVSCQPVGRGSTCMVIGDGSGSRLYVLNSKNEWTKM